ncbi:sodium/bile acid cotransporter 7 [Novosphingobium chloroacetimidivorans]|uniref:Sodium/bile acid cotransporter 7 n=1 Tax=Novosphingobium chloroacetimidivorans TaxID=1428314 RepID=A0A7W7K7Z8_9SPHN|nr:bile acid:sodium symporter family protein [Novosphingobium chloroacetimidivorans]MBB4857551.1 sodium/bile acid cotransporter 7 [Novosphingobium chloroacetimidivorans]
MRRFLAIFEPFVLALLGTVLLASVLPVRGQAAAVADVATTAGIVLLFFLHGAKLSREAILEGARNWRLHLAVLGTTFVLFPLLGLGLTSLPLVQGPLAAGLLFLTLLPSTVQSSIAFTALARGNVAAAVCSASFSNVLGIFLTPALVALLMARSGAHSGVALDSIETIALQLMLPFALGHFLRPWIGAFVSRRKTLLTLVDRGSILLVVYTAFSAAVVEGLWSRVTGSELTLLAVLCCVLLAAALGLTTVLARIMRLPREDAIVLLFCGSKKSLASGVPMAGVLFAPAQVGAVLLPLMLFHQIQLIACAFIARRASETPAPAV